MTQELTAFEKVMLVCGELQMKAFTLNDLIKDYRVMLHGNTSPIIEVHQKRLQLHEEELENVLFGLVKVRERLCDYLNGCDAVSDFDIEHGELVFNQIEGIAKQTKIEPPTNTN